MTAPHRTVITDLASDLAWLEEHARKSNNYAEHAVLLRFAAGLVRNQIGPFLDGLRPPPMHLAVVGGAGSGKSTIANLLVGAVVAEANPQAGFTRHPIAYVQSEAVQWYNHEGLLQSLRRLTAASSSNLDDNVYQVRSVSDTADDRLLRDFVIWDCPDMTTWAASGYAPRLLEVAALADVVVYVASDERYNDAVPTHYLRLLLQAGKPIVAVLTKMKPTHAADIIAHFKKEVVQELPKGRLAIFAVPHLTPDELAEPVAKAAGHRIPIVNQIAVLGEHPEKLRQADVVSSMRFLQNSCDQLLAAARDDVQALEQWQQLVTRGEAEFNERYRREFLTGAKFHRFDEALVRLIDLLELPGVGKFFANALYVVRTPYRLVKGFIGKMLGPPDAPTIPEQPVLEAAFAAWTDQIRATALARQKQHELWNQVARGFEAQLSGQLREKFEAGMRDFQAGQRDEIDATARAIYEDLEKSPNTLAALRGSKLALDVAAITGGIVMGGIGWTDLIIVPLAASVSQQLVEWLGAGYVELQRDNARQRQMELMAKVISRPVGEWLIKWPTTGGTHIERMQLAVTRVPQSLQQLRDAIGGA
jgi:energy-coupling factor transporter ATP-binding protein EcfA2